MDRQTHDDSIYHASIASRGKKTRKPKHRQAAAIQAACVLYHCWCKERGEEKQGERWGMG